MHQIQLIWVFTVHNDKGSAMAGEMSLLRALPATKKLLLKR
jgi:hypothetical protein